MAASVRSSSKFESNGSVTSGTVPLPTGWQPGDVVLLGCSLVASSGTITGPGAGWSTEVASFHSSASTSASHAVFRRVMQAGDANPAVACSSGRLAVTAVAIQGADSTTPIDVTATFDTNSGVSFPSVRASSITPVTNNCLLITFHAGRNGTNSATTTYAPDASETEVIEADSANVTTANTSNASIEAAQLALGTAGATGTKTATVTSSSGTVVNPMGSAIAIRPGAASITGTAAVRLKKMKVSATAVETIPGTAAISLKKMKVSATATETITGTGAIRLKKMGVSASAVETITGTSAVSLKKMSVSASGPMPITGVASVTLKKIKLSGTAVETITGTGAISLKKMGISAFAVETITGTSVISLKKLVISVTAIETVTGTVAVNLKKMNVHAINVPPKASQLMVFTPV